MTIEQPETIRRYKDGSIDFRHYQNKGHIARSQSAHSLFANLRRWVLKTFYRDVSELQQKTNAKFYNVPYSRSSRQLRAIQSRSKLRNAA